MFFHLLNEGIWDMGIVTSIVTASAIFNEVLAVRLVFDFHLLPLGSGRANSRSSLPRTAAGILSFSAISLSLAPVTIAAIPSISWRWKAAIPWLGKLFTFLFLILYRFHNFQSFMMCHETHLVFVGPALSPGCLQDKKTTT